MTLLVILVYLLAIGIPVYLLYRFHSQAWYWRALAIAAARRADPLPYASRKTRIDAAPGYSWDSGAF